MCGELDSVYELDKLGSQALNYYQEKAVTEGRGRFPGQTKYNVKVEKVNLLKVKGKLKEVYSS